MSTNWLLSMLKGEGPENLRMIVPAGDSQYVPSSTDRFYFAWLRTAHTRYPFSVLPLGSSIGSFSAGYSIADGPNTTRSVEPLAEAFTDTVTTGRAMDASVYTADNAVANQEVIATVQVRPNVGKWIGNLGVTSVSGKIRYRLVYEDNSALLSAFKWRVNSDNLDNNGTWSGDVATTSGVGYAAVEGINAANFSNADPNAISSIQVGGPAAGLSSGDTFVQWGGLVGKDDGGTQFDDTAPWLMAIHAEGGSQTASWDVGPTVGGNTIDWTTLRGFLTAITPTVNTVQKPPNAVMLGLGHNDAPLLRTAETYIANLKSIMGKIDAEFVAASFPKPSYIIPLLWQTQTTIPRALWVSYGNALRAISGYDNVNDRYIVTPNMAEAMGYAFDNANLSNDGIHPNTGSSGAAADRLFGDDPTGTGFLSVIERGDVGMRNRTTRARYARR